MENIDGVDLLDKLDHAENRELEQVGYQVGNRVDAHALLSHNGDILRCKQLLP